MSKEELPLAQRRRPAGENLEMSRRPGIRKRVLTSNIQQTPRGRVDGPPSPRELVNSGK